jgi:outer membrane protein assembly factor BamB
LPSRETEVSRRGEGGKRPLRLARTAAALAALTLCAAASRAPAADAGPRPAPSPDRPVGWRYDGTGRFPGPTPPTRWDPRSGENILWKTCLPEARWGNAQPIAVGPRVFVQYEATNLVCLDDATGEIRWRKDLTKLYALDGPEREETLRLAEEKRRLDAVWLPLRAELGRLERALERTPDDPGLERRIDELEKEIAGPRERSGEIHRRLLPLTGLKGVPWKTLMGYAFATPVTDGAAVYVKYATGAVAAVELDGAVRWMRAFPYDGGHSSVASPRLVAGRLVFTRPGPRVEKKETTLLTALDPADGRTLWETPPLRKSQGGGTTSPIPVTLGSTDVIVTGGGAVVRAADGFLLARAVCTNTYCTPPPHGDVVFFCHDQQVEAVRLRLASPDRVEAETLWKTKPTLDGECSAFYGGPVWADGCLHVLQDFGQYYVLDAADGTLLHASRPFGPRPGRGDVAVYANLSCVGGLIFGLDQKRGRMAVIRPGPAGEVVAVNGPLGKGTASPFFRAGRIYVRTHDFVYCIAAGK